MNESKIFNMEGQPQFNVEAAIEKFLKEEDVNKLTYEKEEEAFAEVDRINKKYGNISFVYKAKDIEGFTIKFRDPHLGEYLEEYKGKPKENKSEAA